VVTPDTGPGSRAITACPDTQKALSGGLVAPFRQAPQERERSRPGARFFLYRPFHGDLRGFWLIYYVLVIPLLLLTFSRMPSVSVSRALC